MATGHRGGRQHTGASILRSGELEPVLEEWSLPPAAAWAVFPGRRWMPARTRVLLDTLEAEFSRSECQAQIAKEQHPGVSASTAR